MFRSWASGQKAKITASPSGLTAETEQDALAQAMAAAMSIMNDDLEGAEKGLQVGDSAFHKLGRGLIAFLRAALGFEKEVMREAQDKLSAAEAQASKEQRSVQKEPAAFRSTIYEPGSEYSLTYAQCLLMGAVVAVLNESLTEALRGFYNMRKAYMTLSSIVDAEETYLRKQAGSRGLTSSAGSKAPFTTSAASTQPNSTTASSTNLPVADQKEQSQGWEVIPKNDGQHDDEDDEDAFEDAEESTSQLPTPMEYQGKTETHGVVKDLSHLHVSTSEPNMAAKSPAHDTGLAAAASTGTSTTDLKHPSANSIQGSNEPDADVFRHPIDVYVHSGANLCFGMLLMMLSMIPPAFGKLLSIIGFRGDRERGLRMLWKASKFHNINGAMAGLVVLVFYNGLIGFCDILPDASPDAPEDAVENIEGYPIHRLEALLAQLRASFPKSGLWKLEEARMLAAKKQIDKSIPILSQELNSPLKQVNALAVFERALQAMYSHRFELCADSFIACIKLNNWSHALYFYLAGAAHVEIYRNAIKEKDEAKAKQAVQKADNYFSQVVDNAGKRKFMAKQMPFEVFCIRKLSKWQERAKEWNVPMIDAIGASPLSEMVYHWNGYKKMTDEMLERSLESVEWNEKYDKHWSRQSLDEKAITSLLRAATLRSLRRFNLAQDVLKSEILCHDRSLFTGGHRDDWTLPVAHYEMAVNLWQTRTDVGATQENNEQNRRRVREAQEWVDKVKNWGAYVLDARIGMRVTAAEGTLRKWRALYDN